MVYLLCFDLRRRLLLTSGSPPAGGGVPTLPMIRCQERETYERAARRLLLGRSVRRGDVVARVRAAPFPGGGYREARVYTAHSLAPQADLEGCWIPWCDAVQDLGHLKIPELAVFVEGYLGGWIPDGWITLEP
jgi:hypothetical protein